jgi:hypothetical protein
LIAQNIHFVRQLWQLMILLNYLIDIDIHKNLCLGYKKTVIDYVLAFVYDMLVLVNRYLEEAVLPFDSQIILLVT